jgi:hypothetical protein
MARANAVELTLRTRDPATGQVVLAKESVDPQHVGVLAVDVWNSHWCKPATMRVDAIVPRMNKALVAARELGMTVMLCPSDVVENYAGYPQREAIFALPKATVPKVMDVTCPPVPDAGGCACGRERCAVNYGWDGMHPGLTIGPNDWMPDTEAGLKDGSLARIPPPPSPTSTWGNSARSATLGSATATAARCGTPGRPSRRKSTTPTWARKSVSIGGCSPAGWAYVISESGSSSGTCLPGCRRVGNEPPTRL